MTLAHLDHLGRLAPARLDRDGWSTFDDVEAGFDWGQWIGVWGGASVLLDVAPDGGIWLPSSSWLISARKPLD